MSSQMLSIYALAAMFAALLLCFIGWLIPLAVPFLQSGVSAVAFVAAMALASTIADVGPFSTNGALVLANAQGVDRQVFFQKLVAHGAAVTLIAPIVVWFLFVVL